MITTIRSQFKQATYRYIVFFMVFIIAASMVSSLLIKTERGTPESWAVRVNGAEISYVEFSKEVAKQTEYLAHIRAQYGQYADLLLQSMGWALDPKVRALDILIKEELISQYGKKLGLVVSNEYITASINNAQFVKQYLGHIIPPFAFDKAGMLDMNIIKTFLRQQNITPQQFEQSIERALIQIQIMDLVGQAQTTAQFDVKQYFIAHHLGKTFSYLSFSLDNFIAQEKKNAVTDEDLQMFYDLQNKQFRRYWVPEKRAGLVWKLDPKKYNISISSEEIARYYEDNKVKSYVLDPLKVEVQKIVEKGTDMPKSKSISLDTTSGSVSLDYKLSIENIRKDLLENPNSEYASRWQSIKPFARGEHKGELEKEAFTLQNEGDISPVFETTEGPTIIKLVKRIPRTYKTLASVTNEIKDILMEKAFKKSFSKDIKALIQGDNAAVESFMLQKAGKKETVSGIMKDDSRLSQELFNLKKDRYAFYLEGETGVVVMLTDIADRYLPELNSIKDVVTGDYYEYQARNAMIKLMNEVESAAKTTPFAQLQAKFGGTSHHIPMIRMQDHKQLNEYEKKGLPMREMMSLEKINSIITFNNENEAMIIALDAIESFDESAFLAAKKEVESQLGAVRRRLFVDSFVASLYRNATIETNESIISSDKEYSE